MRSLRRSSAQLFRASEKRGDEPCHTDQQGNEIRATDEVPRHIESVLKSSVAIEEVAHEDSFPERAPGPYRHKETRDEKQNAATSDNGLCQLPQRVAALDDPKDSDDEPEGDEVGSQEEGGGAERADGEVEKSETNV